MNKLRMLCLALVLTLLLPYICYAQDSTDQTAISAADDTSAALEFDGADEWAVTELTQAYDFGLTTERSTIEMSSSITREEFCELAVLFYEKYTGKEVAIPAQNPFTDTDNPTVLKAVELGITTGFMPLAFNPNGIITKQDMAVMIVRAMKASGIDTSVTTKFNAFTDFNKISSHAMSSVEVLQERGILKGVSVGDVRGVVRYMLDPLGSISKQEAVILLKRTFEYACMVRNASKWGPEVYIPEQELGEDYLISDRVLLYENDIFDLRIAPGTPVSVNFEQRLYDMFGFVEEETGFKRNSDRKTLIIADMNYDYDNVAYNNYNLYEYSDYLAYSSTQHLSSVITNHFVNQDLISNVFFRILQSYNYRSDSSDKHILISAICKYAADKVETKYLNTVYSTMSHYRNGFIQIEKQEFENDLAENAESCFTKLVNIEFLGDEYWDSYYYFSTAYYMLFNYINDKYGSSVLKSCFSEIMNHSKTTFGDFSTLIYRLKRCTSLSLFTDFKKWYESNKHLYNISDVKNAKGITEPLCIETAEIKGFHPSLLMKKGDYSDMNIISYMEQYYHPYDFKFISDTLTIDYTMAIALSQIQGFEIKGISMLINMDDYVAKGVTFDVYDANGDIIFMGPTKKYYPGIHNIYGYLFFYGGVKIVFHAPPGTVINYNDGSYMTSELLVKQ